ncbi:MAG: glyoxalase [Archangium gephyra]|uniref:Glyoxalase n=1 Tax=Archangium gephyra TaxID=48 RepID=A0A2W5SR10_9BACT|nr:MAG: glyoxalase [Archangium gephyra]
MNLSSVRLVCRELKSQVAFYEALTGLTARWLAEEFAEISTAACALAFTSENAIKQFQNGVAHGADNHSVIVEFRVDDVDAVFSRASGQVVQPPTTMPWGNRSLLIRDPEGTLINFFAPVTDAAKKRFS